MDHTDFEEMAMKEINILKNFIDEKITKESEKIKNASSKQNEENIKLPKLELKKFNGDPLKWRIFADTFESAIHKNSNISNVEKMNYLVNLLTGTAEETIKGLSLTNNNYEVALQLLRERFDDGQVIISAHMDNLLRLEVIKGVSDVRGLRNLFDQVEGQVRSLETINVKAKDYGPLLIPVILSKIPNEVKLIISRKFENNVWDVERILEILGDELQAREMLGVSKEAGIEVGNKYKQYTASNLITSSAKEIVYKCILCNGEHKPQECAGVTDLSIRKQIQFNIIEHASIKDENNRPVIRPDKITSKVRMVYDASAKIYRPSLNECLHSGPSSSRDIEKSFLHIGLHPDDRDLVRFLWFKDGANNDVKRFENNELTELRLCRVLFGATSSSLLLNATLLHESKKFMEEEKEFVYHISSSRHSMLTIWIQKRILNKKLIIYT